MKELTIFDSLESNEEYENFVTKFKRRIKKTTDDCFTPEPVYEAVARWVRERYGLHGVAFVRPFYPGGDFEHFDYPDGCVAVDNPPFSILSHIVHWYQGHKVPFFLFCNHLTSFGLLRIKGVTVLPIGVRLTYHNGAVVNTSFVTNLSPELLVDRRGDLYDILTKINSSRVAVKRSSVKSFTVYDKHLINAGRMGCLRSEDFTVTVSEGCFTDDLFGGGLIVNTERADRFAEAKAEAEAKAKAKVIPLTAENQFIINKLNKGSI